MALNRSKTAQLGRENTRDSRIKKLEQQICFNKEPVFKPAHFHIEKAH